QKLTITIPVYNEARYVVRTVESCIGQAGKIVLYDNCSTDGSSELCADLAKRYPEVTHIRHSENIGALENFKIPVFECQTEYMALVGAHDILGPDYSIQILREMEKDPEIALAAGTIIPIDENEKHLKPVTRADWANETKDCSPLVRAGTAAVKLRKICLMYYGVYRTAKFRGAWFDTPCLGYDRIMLLRTAVVGKLLYVPGATFYGRILDASRDSKTDRERRAKIIGHSRAKPLQKDNFLRNKVMIETILSQTHTLDDLSLALQYIHTIDKRYQRRRHDQKRRLIKIVASILLALLLAILAIH